MSAALRVLRSGPLTTVQDAGRRGWQRFGVSGSGPMDPLAFRLANRLAGNLEGTGALELALGGLEIEVEAAIVRLGLAGGPFIVMVDGSPAPWWSSLTLGRGQILRIGQAVSGVWGYVAIGGGLELPLSLGSLSTHTLSGLGGLHGRKLRDGDELPLANPAAGGPDLMLPTPPARRGSIRVVAGPQAEQFTQAGIDTFYGSRWRVSAQADRMGYRLEGPGIEHGPAGANIVSDGTMLGSVQVPGAGTPIVLMGDRQTTGGYPKIATVIGADIGALAQTPPGGEISFTATTVAEAVAARRAQTAWLARLDEMLVPAATGGSHDSGFLLSVNLVSGVVSG